MQQAANSGDLMNSLNGEITLSKNPKKLRKTEDLANSMSPAPALNINIANEKEKGVKSKKNPKSKKDEPEFVTDMENDGHIIKNKFDNIWDADQLAPRV